MSIGYCDPLRDIPYAYSVYESESMILPAHVDYFIILIPPEAHESWKDARAYGDGRAKLLTDHNPYYIPTNLTIAEGTSILFINADTPWDAPHSHTVEIIDTSGNVVYTTGRMTYTDSSEPKMLPVGDYYMINTGYETKKASISVNNNSPSKTYKERTEDSLVVGGFYTPTNQIKDNKDKYGELHPGWLGYYKPEFANNAFTILSHYNFNYTTYHAWVAEMGVYLRPRDHTLIIYRTDQPLSNALVKLKKMVKDNAYISDLYFEKIPPYD